MYTLDFKKPISVHFIGIGGISMSGLAEILMQRGFSVSGSDAKKTDLTESLTSKGATVYYGQRAENISSSTDLVVFTAAIREDNPEYAEAVKREIPLMTRADLLGQIMKNYRTSIAVSGTHGKTTTTSMISQILLDADEDPTISIGGIMPSIGSNLYLGNSETFVTEACEYTNSFLSFFPTMAAILNIEADHLDFFKDIDDIRHSFRLFAELLPADGTLVINSDTPCYEQIIRDLSCKTLTYGLDHPADYTAKDISRDENGFSVFTICKKGSELGTVTLKLPGRHNVSNTLAAVAMADVQGIPFESIKKSILRFSGAERRFQDKGIVNGIRIVDDYAHHPTEIRATLNAARQVVKGDLWCIFQPHTFTRTKALLTDFAEALTLADHVILADIYAAREQNTLGISSDDVRIEIEKRGGDAIYLPSFKAIENYVLENCKEGDLLLTMGAGDVVDIGESLLKR